MNYRLHHAFVTSGSLLLTAIAALSDRFVAQPSPVIGVADAPPHPFTAAAPCVRPKARAWRDGETLVIRGDVAAPCTFTIRDTPVSIVSDDSKVPVIGERVVRDRRGRYYTFASGQIAVWNQTGGLIRTVGRLGMGPGEFAAGGLTVLPAPSDQLYVLDNARRLTVFDSSYRLVRTIAANVGLGMGYTFVLEDGTILDGARPQNPAAYFDVKRASGTAPNSGWPEVVRSIGKVSEAEAAFDRSDRTRLVSNAGNGRFWAGPPGATGRGYEIELWTTEGTRLRTIRRDVDWYPRDVDRYRPKTSQLTPWPAELETVQVIDDGLIWVTLIVPNPDGWAAYAKNRQDSTAEGRAVLGYGELIDANAGVVLARTGKLYAKEARKVLPHGWFPRSMLGYRPYETPDGAPAFRILEATLQAR